MIGGERGIRTLDTLPYTHFPGVRLQPLGHLSKCARIYVNDEKINGNGLNKLFEVVYARKKTKKGFHVMYKLIQIVLGIFLVTQAYAFPCYITMVKASCWSDYAVSVDVIDVRDEKKITTMEIPQGKLWVRQELVCYPKETVRFEAKFTPAIWEDDADKVYFGKRFLSFPDVIKKGSSAWNMTVCYTSDFAETPFPPDAKINACSCDMTNIPAVEPR